MPFQPRTLAALTTLAAALCLSAAPAHATVVNYTFTVVPDDPGVAGGSGSFSFDDAQTPGTSAFGEDLFALDSFSFSFAGSSYQWADLTWGDAVFSGGQFLGLDAAVSALFSLVPGASLPDAYFAYELPTQSGYGTVEYRLDNRGNSVPEPATAWLAGLAVLPWLAASRRRARNAG